MNMLKPLAVLALFIISSHLYAQEYIFTYSKLYSHMKQNAKEGHDDVKVGFFFLNVQLNGMVYLQISFA